MRRHEPDVASFLQGILFVGIGLTYLVAAVQHQRVDPLWVLPTLLLGVGVAYLAGALVRRLMDR